MNISTKMSLTASLEDYLEAILVILLKEKTARVKTIAKILNVKDASVNKAISTLVKKGLIEHEKYGYIDLTPKGKKKAQQVLKKHRVITQFFVEVLGVSEKNGSLEACKMEHHISFSTLKRLSKFLMFMRSCKNCPERKKWGF